MNDMKIFVLNEGGFDSLDKDNFLSYKELEVENLLRDFISKRLEYFGYKDYEFVNDLSEIAQCGCEFAAVINMANPFVDRDLLDKMLFCIKEYSQYEMCTSEGAVPGTEPDFVVRTGAWHHKGYESLSRLQIQHDTQLRYNCQLNLRKLKRIKIFKKIVGCIDGVEQLSIPELMSNLKSDQVFEKIISYCEDVPLQHLTKCPNCDGAIEPLKATSSQPMIGYIPDDKPYYYQCVNCKLVVLSPYVPAEQSFKLYDMYYQEGQGKEYFIRRKSRHDHYSSGINMIKSFLPEKACGIDLGSGSGSFVYYMREHYPSFQIIASDFPGTLTHFDHEDHIETKALNFLKEPIGDNEYDLVTAWEVIEHIPFTSFEKVLEGIYNALKPSGIFMFSTPDFDSPLCQAWDFYNVCAPHHMMVLSSTWIKDYFSDHPKFKLVDTVNESEMLLVYESWFKYWGSTSKNFESRALAKLFLEILRDDNMNQTFKELLSRKKWGVEVIVAVQKI